MKNWRGFTSYFSSEEFRLSLKNKNAGTIIVRQVRREEDRLVGLAFSPFGNDGRFHHSGSDISMRFRYRRLDNHHFEEIQR